MLPSQINEHRACERSADFAKDESKLVNRRGTLKADSAVWASGWLAGNCTAGAKSELFKDASPAKVLACLHAGDERFAQAEPLANHRNIERVRAVKVE